MENTVKTYENRNSVGVAETLEVFDDVFKNDEYRAESYGLIYWSHGDGWILIHFLLQDGWGRMVIAI